jgi:hypothetical protein
MTSLVQTQKSAHKTGTKVPCYVQVLTLKLDLKLVDLTALNQQVSFACGND